MASKIMSIMSLTLSTSAWGYILYGEAKTAEWRGAVAELLVSMSQKMLEDEMRRTETQFKLNHKEDEEEIVF